MNKYQRLIVTVAIIDLIVILLFPPFVERTLARNAFPSFDGFYFLFGDRSARPLFLPLLQLEIFFVLINALALFLVFSAVQRGAIAEQERRAADAGAADQALRRVSAADAPEQREAAEQRQAERLATLGRKAERRHHADPKYRAAERRTGNERRHHG